jgi:hypothetical protein
MEVVVQTKLTSDQNVNKPVYEVFYSVGSFEIDRASKVSSGALKFVQRLLVSAVHVRNSSKRGARRRRV